MSLSRPALFERLESAQSILIAGAGGGFDVFAGLPLAFSLLDAGKSVHFANLSFSNLSLVDDRPLHSAIVEVGPDTDGSTRYFPEKFLSRWFSERGQPRSIYALEKVGGKPMTAAYRELCKHLEVDALVLVDGGTDILMRGDEAGLGTPAEDMTSLVAAHAADVPTKLVVCLGFGVDAFHGVCHAHFLENVAALQREGAYLGAVSVLPQDSEALRYLDAVEWTRRAAPERPSIVNLSIASAVEGKFGDVHRTDRTRGSELFINPLMSQYFAFELDPVARRLMYLDALAQTQTMQEVVALISGFRGGLTPKPWRMIPV